jgi:hypothetical protein
MIKKDVITDLAVDKQLLYPRYSVNRLRYEEQQQQQQHGSI